MSTLTAYGYHDGSTRGAIFVAYPSPGNAYAWSNIVSQAGTNHTDFTGDTGTIYGYSRYDTNPDGSSWDIQRSIFIFDTSSLTSSATISDAIFSLNSVSSSGSNANVYTASPASNTDIVNSDHTTYGSTACSSDKSITTGWLDWTLNATGISNISKTGYSRFGMRNSSWDVAGNTPALGYESRSTYVATYAGTTNDPKLVVTYTTPVAPTVTGSAASSVTATSMTGNGNITATGGENCTRRGFCYRVGISGDPTTADSVAYNDGSFGTGAYTKSITGLTGGTSYRVRAYAVNSAGTSYGTTTQEATLSGPVNAKTVNGVAAASIKTFNGVTFTSIKTVNGVA